MNPSCLLRVFPHLSLVSWLLFFPFSSSSYYLSPTVLLSDLSMCTYEKENVCVLFYFFPSHLLRLSPCPTFPHSVKETAYMVPPEVFLITVGAENRIQAGGLTTVLGTAHIQKRCYRCGIEHERIIKSYLRFNL